MLRLQGRKTTSLCHSRYSGAGRSCCDLRQYDQRSAVQLVVVAAVVEFVLEPAGHPKLVLGSHRHVAEVEEPMDVGSEEEPVGDEVRSLRRVRSDVGRFEHRDDPFTGDGTPPLVGVEDAKAERALAEAGCRQVGRPIPLRRRCLFVHQLLVRRLGPAR